MLGRETKPGRMAITERDDDMNIETANKWLPMIKAVADGVGVQYFDLEDGWIDCREDGYPKFMSGDLNPSHYRVKPTPKIRAWNPEEVPVGASIKLKGGARRSLISCCGGSLHEFYILEGHYITCNDALEKYVHSTDFGKTWKPCGVEELS